MTSAPARPVPPRSPWRLLLILALVFFILAALLAGGIISGDLGWTTTPAGWAAITLAWLVP